jgi:5'-3' exonuclease
MGIKSLSSFIRERYPNIAQNKSISHFKSIAIDLPSIIVTYKCALAHDWERLFHQFCSLLLKYNINAIFVAEGCSPIIKAKTKLERKKQRQNDEDIVFNIELSLDMYKNASILTPTLLYAQNSAKKYSTRGKLVLSNGVMYKDDNTIEERENDIDVDSIEKLIVERKKRQIFFIPNEEEIVKGIIEQYNFRYIQAPFEAETLCCDLFMNGDVEGIVSEDSDILCYGGTMLSGVNTLNGLCKVMCGQSVREAMNYTHSQFIDFCILCGTDYNSNIPGYSCKKVFGLMEKYKSFDEITKNIDTTVIDNYPIVYKLFSTREYKEEDAIASSIKEEDDNTNIPINDKPIDCNESIL